ncbi:hypothetical protein BDF14DRAFT_1751596 [Spinellus fusiger]|nr:hypothetical protein BDF14DRAFT_1751596 [Spinellus fusiger]
MSGRLDGSIEEVCKKKRKRKKKDTKKQYWSSMDILLPHYTLYTVYSTIYNLQSTFYILQYTVHCTLYALYTHIGIPRTYIYPSYFY